MPQRIEAKAVSVVIPVRNGRGFIAAAIESVLAQRGPAVAVAEVIVVDNNSTDGTLDVVRDLAAAHCGSIRAVSETRLNAANARNAGARLAVGDWLAFLDADDLWLPDKLQRQIEAARHHPESSLFFTLGEEFHSRELTDMERNTLPCRSQPYPMLTPSSLLLRREHFHRVGNLPDVPAGEFIAWYGWARELGMREFTVPEVLVRRRIHDGNTTRGGSSAAAYPLAMKWLLDRRRQTKSMGGATVGATLKGVL